MFDNTGLDRGFLADVHHIATALKAMTELFQVAVPKLVNDVGDIKAALNAATNVRTDNPDNGSDATKVTEEA